VELVDRAAVDTVAMIRKRLEDIESDIAEEEATRGDVTEEIERLQGQIEWLQRVIEEKTRVVEIASKEDGAKSVEMPFDGDTYNVLLGRFGDSARGRDTPIHVKGWDRPAIRVEAQLAAFDEDAAVARQRVESVVIHAGGDAAQAVDNYHDRESWDRAKIEDEMRFRHADTLPILTRILEDGSPVLSIEIADQAHITTEYGGHSHSAPSVEFPGITIFVPPMKTLRILASEARIEHVCADVEVIAHGGMGTFTDITGDLRALIRSALGGRFINNDTTHSARRIECDDDVVIARVGGDVSVETDSAAVRLREIGGAIRARTVVGDIQWVRTRETDTSMRLESDWGTIHAEHAAIDPQWDDWKWWGTPNPLYAGTGTPDETLDAHIQLFTVAGNIAVTNAE